MNGNQGKERRMMTELVRKVLDGGEGWNRVGLDEGERKGMQGREEKVSEVEDRPSQEWEGGKEDFV